MSNKLQSPDGLMPIRKITISVIPHTQQRYDTIGDWKLTGSSLRISVSDTGDGRANACLAIHELVEALLCAARGISTDVVDEFDIRGPGASLDEPGDDPRAPYYNEHQVATLIENHLRTELRLQSAEYELFCEDAVIVYGLSWSLSKLHKT